jgi:adenylate cyclase
MLSACAELDRESSQEFNVRTRIGIGVNSGLAQVGNIGSAAKFKYGPLGDTVNVASRIQGMTKHLKCQLLVSSDTWTASPGEAAGRRVVQVQVVGVKQPRDLYELADAKSGKQGFFLASEEALEALEKRDFPDAVWRAANLLQKNRDDGPLQLTLSRASQALESGGEGFVPVWSPPSK